MKETTTDLLPDKEILGSKLNPRVATKMSAGAEAGQIASAISRGGRFRCARIGAEVSPTMCVKRFEEARDAGNVWSPCLECAKVLTMMKDLPTPPAKQPPKPAPEVVTMPKPVKKEVPATEARLEIVPQKVVSNPAPFPGWAKFRRREQISPGEVFARFGKTSLSLSAAASDRLGLGEFGSVDVYHSPGKIGLHFRPEKEGSFALSKETKCGRVRKLSCASLIKALGLEWAMDRRLDLRQVGPGMAEIELGVKDGPK